MSAQGVIAFVENLTEAPRFYEKVVVIRRLAGVGVLTRVRSQSWLVCGLELVCLASLVDVVR